MAERYAAVHTSSALLAQLLIRQIVIDLKPVIHSLSYRASHGNLALEFEKSRRPSHDAPAPSPSRWQRAHSATCRRGSDRWRSPTPFREPHGAHASTRAERPLKTLAMSASSCPESRRREGCR